MKIRIVTLNNLIFDLVAKGEDLDLIASKIFEKKFIKVNANTYIQTNCIAIIQKLN